MIACPRIMLSNPQVLSARQYSSMPLLRRSHYAFGPYEHSQKHEHLHRAMADVQHCASERRGRWSLRSLLAQVGAIVVCVAGFGQRASAHSPTSIAATRMRRFIVEGFGLLEQSGRCGYALLIVAFSTWGVFSMPSTIVELATAYVYGALWGFVASVSSKTIASAFAFALVRLVKARRSSVNWSLPNLQSRAWSIPERLKPKLAALKSKPVVSMVSFRLAPVPCGIKNYGLALCDVSFIPYMLAAWIVNVPFSVLWAITGSSCYSLQEAMSMGSSMSMWPKLVASIAGVSVALLAWYLSASTSDSQQE
mmetsp:Transcript_31999/g.73046  ORF Transcript_31999/g.73046 Transcript_31999/m.73046 type:complete len:308 (+) Transcript_31999:95-1018(+)